MLSITSVYNTHVNYIDDQLKYDNLLINKIDNQLKSNNLTKSDKIAVKSEVFTGCWEFVFLFFVFFLPHLFGAVVTGGGGGIIIIIIIIIATITMQLQKKSENKNKEKLPCFPLFFIVFSKLFMWDFPLNILLN